jgi:Outer membrane receptor proteins, mostly Fe transport
MRNKPKKNLSPKSSKTFSKKSLMLFTCFLLTCICSVYAQTKSITGKITSETNEPLIGVNVRVQGAATGTISDLDGNYNLSASAGDVLEFSFVGMKSKSVKVGTQNVINVVMTDDATVLSETVVIGYGSAKKRDLTGSIVNIKGEEIANQPSTNPLASLQGKVAGVQVVNTGRAGQDPEIRIRGTNSINGYTPLYIVDGLFNDNISFLNPSDIESMEILKDPSSLAIFGVRGANGVIIITTKKAKEGQTMVNINSSVGFKTVGNKMELTNAAQFKELYNEQRANEGTALYDFSNWNADTDWQDEIFKTGFITNNNISITGATEKSRFYLGTGYTSEEGNIKHEKFSKTTINLSSDYNLTKNLKVGFQFNGARLLPPDSKSVLNALYATPVAPVFNDQYQLYAALPDIQKAQISNPMVDVELKKRTTIAKNYRMSGNVYGEINFLKHFNFRTMYSMDYRSDDSRTYTPIISVYDQSITTGTPIDVLGTKKTAIKQVKTNETKVQSDYLLTYANKFNEHSITATAGITTYYNNISGLTAERKQGTGLPISNNPDKWFVSIGDAETSTNSSEQWERSTLSMLFRALYNYKNKYLFNGSFRRDGSSAFYYTGNQWQSFYSVGGGWIVSEENFMKNQHVFDFLKAKASWGTLGNQNMNTAYPAEPVLENNTSAVFGDNVIPGYALKYIPNPNLKWEKVDAWEAGLEAYMLKNRLHLEGVYYKKNTKNLLATVPGIAGTTPGLGNLGEIENKGIELAISWSDKINDDWKYSIGTNFTTIKNKVIALVQSGYTIIDGDKSVSQTMEGYPIGYYYGYKVEGVYQSQNDITNSPTNTLATVNPGDLKFKDINGDKKITTADRSMIGNPTPDFTYGVSLGLSYKNFDLTVDMMGQNGNEIYRTWDNYNWSQFNYMAARVNRWHGEGTSNSEPLLNTKHTINNLNSDYYIENGSFIKIRNIQLAYSFDKALLNKVHLKALKIYANAQNPKIWKNNTGYTPEIGGTATAFGIDNGTYPVPAIYTFGFNLSF